MSGYRGTGHAEVCPSCGAEVGTADGPTHPYMVASPACWAAFGELQAAELQRFGYPEIHGLVVDCYAASHGGDGTERRDRQSVFIHLIALCGRLERGLDSAGRIALLQRLTAKKRDWPVVWPPDERPALDHTHLRHAADRETYERCAWEWARAVWAAYRSAHADVREALDGAWD